MSHGFSAALSGRMPRDALPANRGAERTPETEKISETRIIEIPGIELISSIIVRRCVDPYTKNELHRQLGLERAIESAQLPRASLIERIGSSVSGYMKPVSHANGDPYKAFQKTFDLQEYCRSLRPVRAVANGVDVFRGKFGRNFVALTLDRQTTGALNVDTRKISKRMGARNPNKNKGHTRGHISLAVTEDHQSALMLAKTLSAEFEEITGSDGLIKVQIGKPMLFSGSQPISVEPSGVEELDLL